MEGEEEAAGVPEGESAEVTPSDWLFLMAAIGFTGVVYEFTAPGWILPGAVGGTLFAIGTYKLLAGGMAAPRIFTVMTISVPVFLVCCALVYVAVRGARNKTELETFHADDAPIAR